MTRDPSRSRLLPRAKAAPVLGMLALLLAGVPFAASGQEAVLALRGLDPVELVRGREVAGREELAAVSGRYLYRFCSEDTRTAFVLDPAAFSIQFDGACMKMGPLSGTGDPARWRVHAGRIYLFASEGCRDAFTVDPEKFIDTDDPLPTGGDVDRQRATLLLTAAARAIGGEETLRALRTVQYRYSLTYFSRSDTTRGDQTVTLRFPDTYRVDAGYGTARWSWMLHGSTGRDPASDTAGEVGQDVVRHMRRTMLRDPVALLKAWFSGDAVAVAAGPDTVGGVPCERVSVAAHGATCTLSIDPASGRILRNAHRGRTSRGIGMLRHEYADFRPVGGLVLPFSIVSFANGTRIENPLTACDGIEINAHETWPPLDAPR